MKLIAEVIAAIVSIVFEFFILLALSICNVVDWFARKKWRR